MHARPLQLQPAALALAFVPFGFILVRVHLSVWGVTSTNEGQSRAQSIRCHCRRKRGELRPWPRSPASTCTRRSRRAGAGRRLKTETRRGAPRSPTRADSRRGPPTRAAPSKLAAFLLAPSLAPTASKTRGPATRRPLTTPRSLGGWGEAPPPRRLEQRDNDLWHCPHRSPPVVTTRVASTRRVKGAPPQAKCASGFRRPHRRRQRRGQSQCCGSEPLGAGTTCARHRRLSHRD
mmetsp:Transcript_30441/g.51401  ORF Transcript_30441/g.51401 Transcript_30441/m.51401 type:complete len:234 (+) Transcript_30441:158-859(+)